MRIDNEAALRISIHALREEGDGQPGRVDRGTVGNFNPRPPRGGRRGYAPSGRYCSKFQSTPSARRATWAVRPGKSWPKHFNPRPPRGGRLDQAYRLTLLELFQSTPSARRATFPAQRDADGRRISIHALREEGDVQHRHDHAGQHNFNPRPPRGGRRDAQGAVDLDAVFQSTPSARRATSHADRVGNVGQFQSTPSARRATYNERLQKHDFSYFNPRPPRGGRPRPRFFRSSISGNFNPRPPRGGRRSATAATRPPPQISIHALREEGDCRTVSAYISAMIFQSTPSARRATRIYRWCR